MYEAFFGLRSMPFAAAPQTDRYVPVPILEHARQTLVRCLERGEGAGLVIGPAGTGKSLLLALLADQFKREFRVALVDGGRLSSRRALLQSILFELRQPFREMDEGELRLSLIDYLSTSSECPRGIVLLVDEAHVLPIRLLEELRLVSNLVRSGEPRVRVALAGAPIIEERFASSRMELFNQRITGRCYLSALNRAECDDYVRARVTAAGGEPGRVFAEEACRAIFQATDGVPRLVNQVCDHALLLAYVNGRGQVDAATVDEAWADLQQLPSPWSATSGRAASGGSSIVEFGELDEPVNEGPHSIPFRLPEPAGTHGKAHSHAGETADEEEFQPAGTIRPEVELVFDTCPDLFGGAFAEEELVIDRCAQLQAESLRLLHSLPPVDWGRSERAARDTHVLSSRSEPRRMTAIVSPMPESYAPREERIETSDPVLPVDDVAPRLQELLRASSLANAARQERSAVAEDEDLIVVEDAGTIPMRPSTAQAVPVRPYQFRQLFARLRHG